MSLQEKMARGAAWMVGARFAIKILGMISTLILVRLLLPADFGLVALATAFIAGLELIKAFKFDIVLIQDQDATRGKYNAAWTINLSFSVLLAAVLILLAPIAGEFYSDDRLRLVLYSLSLSMVLQGIENVGIVDFRKNLDFRKEFIFLLTKKLAGFCVTIPLAFVLRNFWALVGGILASALTGTITSYLMHPFRPRLGGSNFRELIQFSKWLFLNNILYFIRHRSAEFILGRVTGVKSVGLFTVSYEISHLVTNELVAPINRAVFPGYAKIAGDRDKLRLGYKQVMSVITIVAVPAATGIAAIADLFVPIVLGPNWTIAISLIQILAFSGAITTLETNIGSAYIALGRPQILTAVYSFFAMTLLIFLFILVPRYGVIGAAQACLFAGLANMPLQIYLMRRTLGIDFGDLADIFLRPVAGSALMFFAVREMIEHYKVVEEGATQGSLLVAAIGCGALVYILAVVLLWLIVGKPSGPESFVIARLRKSRQPG